LVGKEFFFEIKIKRFSCLFFWKIFSVAEVLNHLNSNQRLLRSHPKSSNNNNNSTPQINLQTNSSSTSSNQTSSNVFNTAAAAITSRFISDPQGKIKIFIKKQKEMN